MVDEWDYFLTHAGEDGWIVNRKPSESAGWDPSPDSRPVYSRELIHHDRERGLLSDERAEELLSEL